MAGIVTPEAVELEFAPGGLGSRILALGLDLLIMFGALVAVLFVLGMVDSSLSETAAIILLTVITFLILLGYPIVSEALWNGRTVGKAAVGLRVRTREGAPIRFRHAVVRGALLLVDLWLTLGAAAVISMLVTRDSQRLGDLAAGTIVVRERRPASVTAQAVTFTVPAGWEAYAASLDVGAMTSEQYGLVRGFLLRAHELSPEARSQLSVRLAGPLAAILHHEPPGGVHPEAFLVCAAAAYQRRRSG